MAITNWEYCEINFPLRRVTYYSPNSVKTVGVDTLNATSDTVESHLAVMGQEGWKMTGAAYANYSDKVQIMFFTRPLAS